MPRKSKWRRARWPCSCSTLVASTERGAAYRHVDPEDPPPGDVGDDEAPQHDPEDRPETPADRVVAVGSAAPLRRVQIGDHGAAVGRDEGSADGLKDPKPDDGGLVPRQCAGKRTQDEHEETHLVHSHPAEHVAEPTHLGREQGDYEQVADDDPDDRREGYVQPAFDLRQGKDHDRRVDGGDEDTRHDHDHGETGVRGDTGLGLRALRCRARVPSPSSASCSLDGGQDHRPGRATCCVPAPVVPA